MEREADDRNPATSLRIRWQCNNRGYSNYPNQCWQRGVGDPAHNHYPLYTDAVKAWYREIALDQADFDMPPINAVLLLREAKDDLEDNRRKRKATDEAPANNPTFGWPPTSSSAGTHGVIFAPNFFIGKDPSPYMKQHHRSPQSSPPIRSNSSPSSADQRLHDFFEWCTAQPVWRDRGDDLSAM